METPKYLTEKEKAIEAKEREYRLLSLDELEAKKADMQIGMQIIDGILFEKGREAMAEKMALADAKRQNSYRTDHAILDMQDAKIKDEEAKQIEALKTKISE